MPAHMGPAHRKRPAPQRGKSRSHGAGQNNSNFKKSQNKETVKWWSKGREVFYTTNRQLAKEGSWQ